MASTTTTSSVVLSRYAGALVDLAEESKAVEKVQKDFNEMESMLINSQELSDIVSSPLISQQTQANIIADIAKSAKFNKLTQNFLGVLVQNRRLDALGGIIKTYNKIVSERSGEVSVRVEIAEPITVTQEKSFQKKLSSVIGSDVIVETVIVPEILGGMIVTIGSYMVDDSVRRKLERLNAILIQGSNQSNIQNLKEVI